MEKRKRKHKGIYEDVFSELPLVFSPGENVYFLEEGKVHFRRILKIAYGVNGEVAVFEEGCVKKIGVPTSQLYRTVEELKENKKNEL